MVATRLAEDVAGLAAAMADHPADHAWAVEATTALFTTWLAEPGHVRARLELTLMATRDPALATQLQQWRDDLVALVAVVLAERATGRLAVDPPVLVAAFEGLLLASLLQPEDSRVAFARAGIEQLLEVQPHVSRDWAPD